MTNPDRKAAKNSRPELEEHGHSLYTLIVLLVALVFWVAIKSTNIGNRLAAGWNSITACVGNPSGCTSAS